MCCPDLQVAKAEHGTAKVLIFWIVVTVSPWMFFSSLACSQMYAAPDHWQKWQQS